MARLFKDKRMNSYVRVQQLQAASAKCQWLGHVTTALLSADPFGRIVCITEVNFGSIFEFLHPDVSRRALRRIGIGRAQNTIF